MNRILLTLILVLYLSCVGIRSSEADVASVETFIETLNKRTHTPPGTLNEMAQMTYEMLLNVPLTGIRDSQEEIEALIALRHTLETREGVNERVFALRIQEGIERTLLYEVFRKTFELLGRAMIPPHQQGSLTSEIVFSLLKRNEIDQRKHIEEIRSANGIFAKFCRSKNYSTEDFLTGRVVQAFPFDMRGLLQDMLSSPGGRLKGVKKGASEEDLLFALTLLAIDQARDVRVLCDVLLHDLPSSDELFHQQIEQRLTLSPNIRLLNGTNNSSKQVDATWERYIGNGYADNYLMSLTYLFRQYLRASNMEHAKFDEIFFLYTGEKKLFSTIFGL